MEMGEPMLAAKSIDDFMDFHLGFTSHPIAKAFEEYKTQRLAGEGMESAAKETAEKKAPRKRKAVK